MWNRVRHSIRWCLPLLALASAASLGAQQGTGTITGTVVERGSSRPIEAAQVTVVGTRLGAAVNGQGAFTIRGVPLGAHKVRAQFIGFEPIEQSVTLTASGATVAFQLTRTAYALSGVVVTATGEEKRRSVGTAMATMDTMSIARTAASNPQQLLAAASTGVSVLANSGQPGAGATLRLRGVNSVSQGNNPLIYIDGVRVFNGNGPVATGGGQQSSPLNDISPDDIDHIEIVKGPSATTLYGTEASGGVIQIFTKQGKGGGQQWTTSITSGFNFQGHVGSKDDETGMWFNKCRGALNVNGNGVKFEDPSCPASGSWLSNGPIERISVNVRGGSTGGTTYYVGGNWDDEKGTLPRSGLHNRGLRVNLGFIPAKSFNLTINSSLAQNASQGFADGNSAGGAGLNISRGTNSNYKGTGCVDATATCVNNGDLFRSDVLNTTVHFITGATLTYQPTEHFSNRLAVGYDNNNAEVNYVVPFANLRLPLGAMWQTLWHRQMITADLSSTYRRALSDAWSTSSSVGAQVFDSRLYSTSLETDNFSGPGYPTLVSGSIRLINDVNSQRVINAGFFGQEMIGWRDILFVTAGVRIDGNSAFGKSFGLQTYPKISASYVISDESFWPRQYVSSLKLRAAVGSSGKAPGAFDAVRTWDPVAAENGKPAVAPNQLGNADLGPERSREIELGFDLAALDGRINLAFTHFQQQTQDALIPVIQAPSMGFSSSQLMNVGTLDNAGSEITLSGELIRRDNVKLSAKVGMTTLHSNAVNVGGQTLTIFTNGRTYVQAGYPVPSYMGKRVTNPDAIAAPIYEAFGYIGSVFATRTYNPGITLQLYKKVTLEALGEWQLGGHNLNATGYQNANLRVWRPCFAAQAALTKAAAGDLSELGSFTAMERARCTINTAERDYSLWVEKSDFFKLRSISATIDLPARYLRGARNASLTIAGRNLFTKTDYTGFDPESADKTDNTFGRRDYYTFGPYKTFIMTLRVGF
ncbi:MAG: TonB-dependent receptor [Gemmatimonadetes bacterium]|nr:TonB-dependent receptor [Gemmatimonadota bacterium]